jgi:hypothetical protein
VTDGLVLTCLLKVFIKGEMEPIVIFIAPTLMDPYNSIEVPQMAPLDEKFLAKHI